MLGKTFNTMKIKLTKLSASANPLYPTPESGDYIPGKDNGEVSLPVDYEMIGTIEKIPEVGEYLFGYRTHRNGVECPGVFRTSAIEAKRGWTGIYHIETKNSVYRLEIL